jgi:hypothetical protein
VHRDPIPIAPALAAARKAAAMTSLEMGMTFMLVCTVLTGVSAWVLPNDPMRMTRVLLAVGSALVFQLHVLLEGPRAEHWPLYTAGLVVLIAVAVHWFMAARPPGAGPPEPPTA